MFVSSPAARNSSLKHQFQGRVAATALGYDFVDVDEAIEAQVESHNIKTFIETNGWEKFREVELRVFQQVVQGNKYKGGGGGGSNINILL